MSNCEHFFQHTDHSGIIRCEECAHTEQVPPAEIKPRVIDAVAVTLDGRLRCGHVLHVVSDALECGYSTDQKPEHIPCKEHDGLQLHHLLLCEGETGSAVVVSDMYLSDVADEIERPWSDAFESADPGAILRSRNILCPACANEQQEEAA